MDLQLAVTPTGQSEHWHWRSGDVPALMPLRAIDMSVMAGVPDNALWGLSWGLDGPQLISAMQLIMTDMLDLQMSLPMPMDMLAPMLTGLDGTGVIAVLPPAAGGELPHFLLDLPLDAAVGDMLAGMLAGSPVVLPEVGSQSMLPLPPEAGLLLAAGARASGRPPVADLEYRSRWCVAGWHGGWH